MQCANRCPSLVSCSVCSGRHQGPVVMVQRSPSSAPGLRYFGAGQTAPSLRACSSQYRHCAGILQTISSPSQARLSMESSLRFCRLGLRITPTSFLYLRPSFISKSWEPKRNSIEAASQTKHLEGTILAGSSYLTNVGRSLVPD